MRLEAEFYQKKYLAIENILSNKNSITLSTIADKITDGTHFTPTYTESGVVFLSALNVLENQLSFTAGHRYISCREHKQLMLRCDPRAGDILVRKVGVGPRWATVIPKKTPEFSIFVSVALIRVREQAIIPEALSIFINSKYGQEQLLRVQKGASQPDLHLEDIREIWIPNISRKIQRILADLYILASNKFSSSCLKYVHAEHILLDALRFSDSKFSNEKINLKSFKESFAKTGRLDAEYYQPKYEAVINAIMNYKNGFAKFDRFIEDYSTGYPYKSENYVDTGIPLIRINNIKSGFLDLSSCICIPETDKLISPKDVAKEDDILISMSGTIGNSCKIPKGITALINQRIMRITSKNFNVNVLPLLINSIIVKSQLERIGTGGVQTNISSNDIREILIPRIEENIQTELAKHIQESIALKNESEKLLKIAKRSVEVAVEKNEEAAMKYIQEETASAGISSSMDN